MVAAALRLPADEDVWALATAIDDRDTAATRRLLLILKARYGADWDAIGQDVLVVTGRATLRKRKAPPLTKTAHVGMLPLVVPPTNRRRRIRWTT
jgi:hypothetical protein